MGLYLCIFDGDVEINGVEVGLYEDFAQFRNAVAETLEDNVPGSLFPVLMDHSDSDGEWSPAEAKRLFLELEAIGERFKSIPPVSIPEGWKREVVKEFGLNPSSLYDCFFDVDGEPLIERMKDIAADSIVSQLPILFQ